MNRTAASRSGYTPILWGLAVAVLEAMLQVLNVVTLPEGVRPFVPMVAAAIRFGIVHARTRSLPVGPPPSGQGE